MNALFRTLAVLVMFAGGGDQAAAQLLIGIDPPSPRVGEEVTLTLSVPRGDDCFELVIDTVERTGHTVSVTYHIGEFAGFCIEPPFVPVYDARSIGTFESGAYTIVANGTDFGTIAPTRSRTFVVASVDPVRVPIDTAFTGLALALGILLLVCTGRRRFGLE